MQKYLVFLFGVLAVVCSGRVYAETEAERLAEAKIAIDNKDCTAALKLLQGQGSDPTRFFLLSKASECIGDFGSALSYLEDYKSRVRNAEITNELAELRYKSKWAWKKTFCQQINSLLRQSASGFKKIQGSYFKLNDKYDSYESTFQLTRPTFEWPSDSDKSLDYLFLQTYYSKFYRGEIRSKFGDEVYEAIQNELAKCLDENLQITKGTRKGFDDTLAVEYRKASQFSILVAFHTYLKHIDIEIESLK